MQGQLSGGGGWSWGGERSPLWPLLVRRNAAARGGDRTKCGGRCAGRWAHDGGGDGIRNGLDGLEARRGRGAGFLGQTEGDFWGLMNT